MTKLNRVTGKVFGGDATVTGDNPEIGQFGSALAGTYNGTTDVATIQSLPAWGQGWAGAVTPDTNFPALPEMTGFGKVLSYQNNYLLQSGMPEWDSGTIYYTNNFCRVGNVFYYSLTDENQGNDPTTDTTNWATFAPNIDTSQFADINASNFTTTGTSYLSGLGMPSGSTKYVKLTMPSGTQEGYYTAPGNGWFYYQGETNESFSYIIISNETGGIPLNIMSFSSGNALMSYCPAKTNDRVVVARRGASDRRFGFAYAEGDASA